MALMKKRCIVMQYLKFTPDIKTVDDVAALCAKVPNIKTWCCIMHDKDLKDDGTLKDPHFHAVLTFSQNTTFQSVAKTFGIEERFVEQIRCTTGTQQLYLIHAHDSDKYQYSVSDVRANFDYENRVDDIKNSDNYDIDSLLLKIGAGEVRECNYSDYIDVLNMTKYKRQIDVAFKYAYDKNSRIDRTMKTLFIDGDTGVGKTTYAKQICRDKGYLESEIFISNGGSNPLDGYRGQYCIILDDLRDSDYKLNEFLKLTDNNTSSQAHSRFYDKNLVWCKFMIVTSSIPFADWYSNLRDVGSESIVQLERRFPERLHMTEDYIYLHSYNLETRSDSCVGKITNPVKALYSFSKEDALEAFRDILGDSITIIDDVLDDGFEDVPDDDIMPFI